MTNIFTEGDKARKWGYQSTDTADVYAKQKLSVIIGKLREEYCRRHVAYQLAGKRADKKSSAFQKRREKLSDSVYSCHVSWENKEENEGQKKTVIDVQKSASIHKEKHRGYYYKPN